MRAGRGVDGLQNHLQQIMMRKSLFDLIVYLIAFYGYTNYALCMLYYRTNCKVSYTGTFASFTTIYLSCNKLRISQFFLCDIQVIDNIIDDSEKSI